MGKFCPNCGKENVDGAVYCAGCGTSLASAKPAVTAATSMPAPTVEVVERKSRLACGLLALVFGTLGIHNYYLGYKSKALTQLLLSTVGILLCGLGPVITLVWSIVEAIQIFSGTINNEADGTPLKRN